MRLLLMHKTGTGAQKPNSAVKVTAVVTTSAICNFQEALLFAKLLR